LPGILCPPLFVLVRGDCRNSRSSIERRRIADLLRPFEITSETVHIPGLKDAMGYLSDDDDTFIESGKFK
jgi:hypothetical protein